MKDLFVQELGRVLTGVHSFEKIGVGITDSSFLLNEDGNRVAVLKELDSGNYYSPGNWECLIRDLLGEKRQGLVPGIAEISVNGIVYMAVEYLKSINLSSAYSRFDVKKYLKIPSFLEDLQTICLLDLIFSNTDRNPGNLLLTCAGFKGIDHDFLLNRGMKLPLDGSKILLGILDFFKHKELLQPGRDFLDSLTPEFIKSLASKYRDQLQRHFQAKVALGLSYTGDHVARFEDDERNTQVVQ